MAEHKLFVIDAFTDSAFAGNSAGVVLDADGLSEAQMQAIAREINAGATAFVARPTQRAAAYAYRWFSPACEIQMCGHGMLAATHALIEAGRVPHDDATLAIETRYRGLIDVRIERSGAIWLESPRPTVRPFESPIGPFLDALCANRSMLDSELAPATTSENDLILPIVDQDVLMQIRPRSSTVKEVCEARGLRGVLVTTRWPRDGNVVVRSRFFVPTLGIAEDSVSGSVHGPLGVYLVGCGVVPLVGGRAAFACGQGQPGGRSGVVRVEVVQNREGGMGVHVGGSCRTAIRGKFAALP